MGDENFKITKGYLLVGLLGALTGGIVVYGIIKWLPEYQEKIANRQGEIIVEKFEKRIGPKLEELEKLLREYRGA